MKKENVASGITMSELEVQNLVEPLGLTTANPVFSWKLNAIENNKSQKYYQIMAASSEKKLEEEEYDLWDSGKVASNKNYGVVYEGKELTSMEKVYWKVTAWDEKDEVIKDSETSSFEMGILENDWTGKWITYGKDEDYISAPIFAKEFDTENQKIADARLYIAGLGMFEAHINGNTIAEGTYYNAGESDVRDTIYYCTYDVTDYMNENGANAVAFMLGNGQYANYRIHMQPGRYYKTDDARSESDVKGMFGSVKGIAQVVVTYEDGTKQIIATDDTWNYIESPITENSWYGGEDYDATMYIEGWDDVNPELVRDKWGKAVLVEEAEIPSGTLRGREHQPISIIESDTCLSENITVTTLKEENGYTTYLVDMGRNGAGFEELTIDTQTAGQVITMYPAENNTFDGYNGHINQASCTQSASTSGSLIYDTYITSDKGKQVYSPTFCYHGYRYVEVSAPSEIKLTNENFKGYILRTENQKTGSFTCSDEILNQINTLTDRSIESNMYSTFTDCPQIEKLGWLETPGLMYCAMSQTFDISSWSRKIIQDMVDAQAENGMIAAIAPEYFRIGTLYEDLNWNGSIIFTAWQYYETYGDKSIFSEKNVTAMKDYMSYLSDSVAKDNIITRGQMGEWGEMTTYGTTPMVLVETTAYYRLANTMADISAAIGNNTDKAYYEDLAAGIQKAFYENTTCHNDKNLFGSGTQSSYGCVLYSGIAYEEDIQDAVDRLVAVIEKNDYHLTSGEVGLKQVFCSLAENGRSDIIYQMVTNDSMPSYKYFVEKGLTTLPEYWNFEDLWGSVSRSQNHAMMGHVKEWFMKYLGGITNTGVAYDTIDVKPNIVEQLEYVNTTVDSVHGEIISNWKYDRESGELTMELVIPVGVNATVYVPIIKDGQIITCNEENVDMENTKDGYMKLKDNIGSGTYIIVLSY